MIPVLWTVDPLDWCSKNVACVVDKVVNKAKENDIILMHDYYESTVTAAFEIVDQLQKEGVPQSPITSSVNAGKSASAKISPTRLSAPFPCSFGNAPAVRKPFSLHVSSP